MKRPFSFLFILLLVLALPVSAAAAGEHVHTGTLVSLCTDPGSGIPSCGVFRCDSCGQTYEATVSPADVGMPIVKLEGSVDGMSYETSVKMKAVYDDGCGVSFVSGAVLKWQGASSLGYPKKNFSIRFVKNGSVNRRVELCSAWGAQSKYCLKANWVDVSAARNIVSARLWGEIVHAELRDDAADALVNGGAVDGFPVLLYINGDLQGLYTLNTPKDAWIFGMEGNSDREGLLFSAFKTRSTLMEGPITDASDPAASGWEVEYCVTERYKDGTGWLIDGMNRLIGYLGEQQGAALREGLGEYLDVERAIDYMLFTFFICGGDNIYENALWVTRDGVKYAPSVYDLDATWGLYFWDGTFPDLIPEWSSLDILRENVLYCCLLDHFTDAVRARYVALREDVLSYENIERRFTEFTARIPDFVYAADAALWPDSPGRAQNTLAQILGFARDRIKSTDALFGVTPAEKTAQGCRARFACEDGAKVFVYPEADPAMQPERAASAYATGLDGTLTRTDGEILFRVELPENRGAAVQISPEGNFAALLGPKETEIPNGYRITGINGALTVRISADDGKTGEPSRTWLAILPAAAAALLGSIGIAIGHTIIMKKRKNK